MSKIAEAPDEKTIHRMFASQIFFGYAHILMWTGFGLVAVVLLTSSIREQHNVVYVISAMCIMFGAVYVQRHVDRIFFLRKARTMFSDALVLQTRISLGLEEKEDARHLAFAKGAFNITADRIDFPIRMSLTEEETHVLTSTVCNNELISNKLAKD